MSERTTDDDLWDEVAEEEASAGPQGNNLAESLQTEKSQPEPRESVRDDPPANARAKEVAKDDSPPPVDRNPDVLTAVNRLSEEIRGLHGRYGGLAQQLDEMRKRGQQQVAQPSNQQQPSATQIADAKTPEEWETLKRDYPDWAVGFEKYMDMREARMAQRFESMAPKGQQAADPMQNERVAAMSQQLETMRLQQETQKVMEAHPDLPDLKANPAFQMWIDNLPPDLNRAARSDNSTNVIRMIDLYKSTIPTKTAAEVTSRRDERLRQAVSHPRGQPAPSPNSKSLDDLSEEQYWELLSREEQRRARH